MVRQKRVAAVLMLVFAGLFLLLFSRPHWLLPHGRATCDGRPLAGATVYRSTRGDLFVHAPSLDLQIAMVSPRGHDLGRCNTPAFTSMFGLLFSRERDPEASCTSMWKGGDSHDPEPTHVVTDNYAEFPWGSCPNLRVEY